MCFSFKIFEFNQLRICISCYIELNNINCEVHDRYIRSIRMYKYYTDILCSGNHKKAICHVHLNDILKISNLEHYMENSTYETIIEYEDKNNDCENIKYEVLEDVLSQQEMQNSGTNLKESRIKSEYMNSVDIYDVQRNWPCYLQNKKSEENYLKNIGHKPNIKVEYENDDNNHKNLGNGMCENIFKQQETCIWNNIGSTIEESVIKDESIMTIHDEKPCFYTGKYEGGTINP